MVQRMYVRGLGSASPQFFDADTDRSLSLLSFRMDANTFPDAEISEMSNSGPLPPVLVKLEPWPGPRPGAELVEFQAPKFHTGGPYPTEEITTRILGWMTAKDGTVCRDTMRDAGSARQIDHQILASITDLDGLFCKTIENTYREAAIFMADAAAKQFLGTPEGVKELHRWRDMARKAAPRRYTPPSAPAAAKPSCPECCGTGYWKGSGKPCSMGCKP